MVRTPKQAGEVFGTKQLLQQVLQLAPTLIVVYDIHTGQYRYINDAVKKLGPSFIASLTYHNHPHILAEFKKTLKKANSKHRKSPRDKPIFTYEHRIRYRGSWRWFYTESVVFTRDTKGKVQQIMDVSLDITDRKNAEEKEIKKREQLETSFLESEKKYRLVVENSHDLINLLDIRGKILYASPSWKRILGFNPEEVIGKAAFSELIHPDDSERAQKEFAKGIMGEIAEVTVRVKHKNGTYRMVEGSGSAVFNEKGKPYMVVSIARDVTTRVNLERQKDEFISIASHELKTPVTSLKLYTQVLQKKVSKIGDEKSALLLVKMDLQLDKLTNLITDLLDVSTIEKGELQLRKEWFDFNELVSEIVEEMQRMTEDNILVKHFGKTKTIYGDRNRIGQVLINLIANAIKYSPLSDRITITTHANKHSISASVQDFGEGIAKKNQKAIFERFYRISNHGKQTHAGLGLGLYISTEIIRRHNGKIWVESKKGQGATFSFSLPMGD